MSTTRFDCAIVGGGIVGLATALALQKANANFNILLIEKEDAVATHQTGHNSGVIHSGLYYTPGSLKARYSIEGAEALKTFCSEHNIPFENCGKVIVATEDSELPGLEKLFQRGLENKLAIQKLTSSELKAVEPFCSGVAAIHVPGTGIVDYKRVAEKMAHLIVKNGAVLKVNCELLSVVKESSHSILQTTQGDFFANFVVACGGLQCDRVAKIDNVEPNMRVVPFRGEYYELTAEKQKMIKGLIYPVPDPKFPFLGVHLTRMMNGGVHAGPNAVLALKREGYNKSDIDLKDLMNMISYPAFWKFTSRHFAAGVSEMMRSVFKSQFLKSLQRLVPSLEANDIVPTHAGVRAQALLSDGSFVDDFLVVEGQRSLHILNAPSPAATASFAIGKHIAAMAIHASETR